MAITLKMAMAVKARVEKEFKSGETDYLSAIEELENEGLWPSKLAEEIVSEWQDDTKESTQS